MKNIYTENDLIDVMSKWYDLISKNHHKDRDCHFNICKRFSYGNKWHYYIEHHGYLFDSNIVPDKEYNSYYEARESLILMINKMISEYEKIVE